MVCGSGNRIFGSLKNQENQDTRGPFFRINRLPSSIVDLNLVGVALTQGCTTTTHTEVWCYKWTTLPTTLPKIKITNHDYQANPHCHQEKQRSTHNRKENHHHHHHPPPPDYRHRPQTAPPLNPFANDGYCPNEPWNTVASTKKKKMPKLMPSPRLINWIGSPRNICHHFNPTFETYYRNSQGTKTMWTNSKTQWKNCNKGLTRPKSYANTKLHIY